MGMSISLELSRPARLPEGKTSRASESPSLKNLLSGLARPSQPEPVARVREQVSAPTESLMQRLRESQPAGRPNASVALGKGSWGIAAQSVAAQGFGAYQTSNESYEEEGVSYEKTTSTGPKGYRSTTLTYEKDGVSYVETTTSGNGKTEVRVEATSGDVTEVSTSTTTTVPGDLGDYVDSDVLGEVQANWENGVGATTRTQTKTVVTDNSQDPPLVTVTQESTGYTQQLNQVENLEGGESVYIHDGSMQDKVVTLPEGNYDQSNSGLYVSYTTQTIPEPGSVLQGETRITGTGPDGHPIALSNSRTVTTNAQGEKQVVLHYAEKGTIARQDAEQAYLDKVGSNDEALAGQFSNAESEWLDYEQTTVYSGDNFWPVVTSQFGELNRPGQNSLSATKVENGETEYVTYEAVSENGARLQTETHIPGTNFRSTSDTHYGENGQYTTTSSAYSGGTEISSSQSSRVLLYESGKPLPVEAPQGFSQDQWDQFREAHPNGPVYHDQMHGTELGLDGVETESSSETFSINGSVVGTNSQTIAGKTSTQEYFQLDGPEGEGEMIIDGLIGAHSSGPRSGLI